MLSYDTEDRRGMFKTVKVGECCTTVEDAAFESEGTIPWLYECLGYHSTDGDAMVHIMKLQHISDDRHPEIGEDQWIPKSQVFTAPPSLLKQFHVYRWKHYEFAPERRYRRKPACKEELNSSVKLKGVTKKVQLQFDAWNRAKTDRSRHTSSYILVWNDIVRAEYGGACHADMARLQDYKPHLVGKLKYIYTAVWDMSKAYKNSNPRIAKACKDFQKYFFLHSPFAQYFKGQSLKGIFRDGLRLSPNLPSNLLMSIITWSRQPWEYPQFIVTWKELVDKGINPDVAMVTCQLLGSPSIASEIEETDDPDYYDKVIYRSPHHTNHSPFPGQELTYQDVIGLCNQELNLYHGHEPYRKELSFEHVWQTFSVGQIYPSAKEAIDELDDDWEEHVSHQDLTPLKCQYPIEDVEEVCEWSGDVEIVRKTRYGGALSALVEYSKGVTQYLEGKI